MRKQISGYNNYYIYDNGDVLNISTNKILKGSNWNSNTGAYMIYCTDGTISK